MKDTVATGQLGSSTRVVCAYAALPESVARGALAVTVALVSLDEFCSYVSFVSSYSIIRSPRTHSI